jgi:tape measure domain-containing protein
MGRQRISIDVDVDASGEVTELRRVSGAVRDIDDASKTATTGGVSSFRAGLASLGGVIAALGLVELGRNVVAVGGNIIDTASKFETLQMQLEAVVGSATGAQAAMDFVDEKVREMPYSAEDLVRAYVRLEQVGLRPSEGALQDVADAASRVGGGSEALSSIVMQLGQAYTVGKLQMEDARVIMERGVDVMGLLAEVTGKTTAEISEMMTKGELTRPVIEQLIEAMGDQAIGASAKLMDTYGGSLSNLQVAWEELARTIGEAGALDAAQMSVEALTAAIPPMTYVLLESAQAFLIAQATMQKWYQQFLRAIALMPGFSGTDLQEMAVGQLANSVDTLETFDSWLTKINGTLSELDVRAGDVGEVMRTGFNPGMDGGTQAIAGTGGLNEAVEESERVLYRAEGQIEVVAEAIGGSAPKSLSSSVFDADGKLAKLGGTLDDVGGVVKTSIEQWTALQTTMQGLIGQSWGDILYDLMTGRFDDILDAFEALGQNVASIMADAMSSAAGVAAGGGDFMQALRDQGVTPWAAVGSVGLGMAGSGIGGDLGAILSGGSTALGIGSLLGASSMLGPAGWIIGGVAGALQAIGSLFGGGEETPETKFWLGPDSGSVGTRGHQGLSDADWEAWVVNSLSMYRSTQGAWRGAMEQFRDPSIMGMYGGDPIFRQDWTEGSARSWSQWLADVGLPEGFRGAWGEAGSAGLAGLGVTEGRLTQFWEEMEQLTGDEQVQYLSRFISVLQGLNTHLPRLQDFSLVLEDVSRDSFEQFGMAIEDFNEQILTARAGLEDMSGHERVQQFSKINDLLDQRYRIEQQMVQSIMAQMDAVTQMGASFRERALLSTMTEAQQEQYYLDMIQQIESQLSTGDLGYDQLGMLQSQYYEALQALLGLGYDANDLIDMSQGFEDEITDLYEGFLDQIESGNQSLLDELGQGFMDLLTGPLADGVGGLGDTIGGSIGEIDQFGDALNRSRDALSEFTSSLMSAAASMGGGGTRSATIMPDRAMRMAGMMAPGF